MLAGNMIRISCSSLVAASLTPARLPRPRPARPQATNRYSAPFRPEVQGWISKLSTVSEVIEQWLLVQNMWMYMEAVFRCVVTGGSAGWGRCSRQAPKNCGALEQPG